MSPLAAYCVVSTREERKVPLSVVQLLAVRSFAAALKAAKTDEQRTEEADDRRRIASRAKRKVEREEAERMTLQKLQEQLRRRATVLARVRKEPPPALVPSSPRVHVPSRKLEERRPAGRRPRSRRLAHRHDQTTNLPNS